jgi:hypothetical protein
LRDATIGKGGDFADFIMTIGANVGCVAALVEDQRQPKEWPKDNEHHQYGQTRDSAWKCPGESRNVYRATMRTLRQDCGQPRGKFQPTGRFVRGRRRAVHGSIRLVDGHGHFLLLLLLRSIAGLGVFRVDNGHRHRLRQILIDIVRIGGSTTVGSFASSKETHLYFASGLSTGGRRCDDVDETVGTNPKQGSIRLRKQLVVCLEGGREWLCGAGMFWSQSCVGLGIGITQTDWAGAIGIGHR